MTASLSNNGMIHAEDLYYLLGGKEPIKILDATYSLPGGNASPFEAFLGQHIEGAQFFDIDAVADQDAPLPHTMPDADYFASCVSAMGISNKDHVVVYDQSGAYMASARAWWMFRAFGHDKVYVLEGCLKAWIDGGYRVASGPADAPKMGEFTATMRSDLTVSKNDLLGNIDTHGIRVLDARPPGRFSGAAQEPRAGKRAGHIPGSYNLPFGDLIDPQSRAIKSPEELERIFDAQKIDASEKIAVSCGSGVTACTVALALFKARQQDAAIYDGSWSEWGDEAAGTPIELSA